MKVTELSLSRWGNSQGVRLSNKLLKDLGWQNANRFTAEITADKKLLLSVVPSQDDGSLAYLFKNYQDDGLREPLLDFGEPVGDELW